MWGPSGFLLSAVSWLDPSGFHGSLENPGSQLGWGSLLAWVWMLPLTWQVTLNVLWNFPVFLLWHGIKWNFSAWPHWQEKMHAKLLCCQTAGASTFLSGQGLCPSWHRTLSWKQSRFSTDVYWIRTYCPAPPTDKISDDYKHAISHPIGLHTL